VIGAANGAFTGSARPPGPPLSQRRQLGLGDLAAHRRQAAVGAGDQPLLGHELQAPDRWSRRSPPGVSIRSEATSITPTITSLPSSRRISSGGTCEWMHSSETWSIATLREGREDLLVLAPFLAERRLPVDVRLDAVAVADVHRGLALQPLRGALERRHAPLRRLGHVDVERRLVELDDVDAVGLEGERLLIEQLGEGERHLDPARLAFAVVAVGNGVDDRHRAGQRELEQPVGMARGRGAPRPRGPGPLRRKGPTTCGTIAS
jgi:hypothetical protein